MTADKAPLEERNVLVMGGLIGMSTLLIAGILSQGSCDPLGTKCSLPVNISIIAFAVGLPTMAISILIAHAWQESEKKVASSGGDVLRFFGYVGLSVGIIAAFFQLSVFAGLLFLAFSIISLVLYLIYTAKIRNANSSPSPSEEDNPSESSVR